MKTVDNSLIGTSDEVCGVVTYLKMQFLFLCFLHQFLWSRLTDSWRE